MTPKIASVSSLSQLRLDARPLMLCSKQQHKAATPLPASGRVRTRALHRYLTTTRISSTAIMTSPFRTSRTLHVGIWHLASPKDPGVPSNDHSRLIRWIKWIETAPWGSLHRRIHNRLHTPSALRNTQSGQPQKSPSIQEIQEYHRYPGSELRLSEPSLQYPTHRPSYTWRIIYPILLVLVVWSWKMRLESASISRLRS